MKKQIRLNVFETNSSTQHALVIRCKSKHMSIADGIPEGVKLPEKVKLYAMTWGDIDNIKLTTIENRILYLYNILLTCNVPKHELITFLSKLNELGINYELTPYDDDVYFGDFSDGILEEIIHKNENLMAFLFADDIFYDTYADDCGSWEQQCEWEDTISEFIKESKNDVIELRDRC
jgi:hypothetical protein